MTTIYLNHRSGGMHLDLAQLSSYSHICGQLADVGSGLTHISQLRNKGEEDKAQPVRAPCTERSVFHLATAILKTS